MQGCSRTDLRARQRTDPLDPQAETEVMTKRLNDLLYQALETELGGVEIYTTAISCAVNKGLKKEWKEYLGQTRNHVHIVRNLLEALDLNPKKNTPGRKVVRHIGNGLVKAMKMAAKGGDAEAA